MVKQSVVIAPGLPATLTVLDAASYLGVSKATIDRRISSGELRSYKNGRLRKIKRNSLLEYEARLMKAEEEARGVTSRFMRGL